MVISTCIPLRAHRLDLLHWLTKLGAGVEMTTETGQLAGARIAPLPGNHVAWWHAEFDMCAEDAGMLVSLMLGHAMQRANLVGLEAGMPLRARFTEASRQGCLGPPHPAGKAAPAPAPVRLAARSPAPSCNQVF
ncbi:unnamed protein product [Symbiodinium natans]|uniref:Uncharacterized protein n=1 Tax=Symbiodinium natans TaxID=878477 RepID=A0A812RI00_9DINO|nr:unnamed protein product [Symbiodinium natans]